MRLVRSVLALLALLCCASAASAAVLGIDYGSEFVKVSIVAPGRTPISIVINEISKRKSTAAVAFTGGDRWLAEEAMNYNARYPDRVFTRLRDLLGRETSVASFQEYISKYHLPYKVVPDKARGTARVVAETGDEFAVEELVAMILQYAMKIGEGMGKGQIKVRPRERTRRTGRAGNAAASGASRGSARDDRDFRRPPRGPSFRGPTAKFFHARSILFPPTDSSRSLRPPLVHQDAVIAVPPYFGQTHRYALYDAADIAGLNILAEVSDLSCAALQWGIDKEFSPEPTWTIVYDMGATSVGAALVRYSSFEAKEAGKKKQHGQFEIKRTAWDATCGGEDMDMLLVDHFLAEFDAKHKPSKPAKSAPRAIAKLRKQVRKTKEILSANKEAPISVEGMHEDHDFRSSIKRSSFESLAESVGLFDRAVAPLKAIVDALPEYNLTLKDVEVVEVIGGATRVPGVKAALQAALGGRQLDVHLDADEAVAMGAGLFAANMSTTFRMRKFGASDAAPYGYEIDLHDPENPGARKNLLARRKRFPVRRVVSVPNATSDRTFSVYHNVTAGPLPPGVDAEKVADFEIAGVAEAMKKHDGVLGDIKAHFAVDNSGILYLEKAEYQVEVVDMVEVKEKPPKKTAEKKDKKSAAEKEKKEKKEKAADDEREEAAAETERGEEKPAEETEAADAEATTAGDAKRRRLLADDVNLEDTDEPTPAAEKGADAEETEISEKEAEEKDAKPKKMRERRRVFRTPLKVTETNRAVKAMTPDQVKASVATLKKLAEKDEAKRAQEAAKSNLEAYIYSIREKMVEDEEIQKVTDEAQREAFGSELTEAEDWLYMDGADASSAEFDAKKAALQLVGDEIIARAKELTRRPAAVAKARAFVDQLADSVAKLAELKPWIPEEDKAKLLEDLKGFEQWLDEKEQLQAKKTDVEQPAFTAAEVVNELKPLEQKLTKLKKTPAPKPPPAPEAPPAEEKDAADDEKKDGDGSAEEAEAKEGETAAEGTEKPVEGEEKEEDHSELRR
jgi:hypoxia up-regulated 1